MSDEDIIRALAGVEPEHPLWKALNALMDQAEKQESDAAALTATGELSLRQCGRLSMIKDWNSMIRDAFARSHSEDNG